MKKSIKLIILFIIATIWVGAIFKLSSMNSHESNGKSTDIIRLFIEDTLDITNQYGITSSYPDETKLDHASELINAPIRKVMHASVYCILAIFIMLFWNIIFNNKKFLLSLVVTFFLCIGFASIDEFHQTFIEGRTGRKLDVAIDVGGACVGMLIYSSYYICYKCGYKKGIGENKK